MDITITYLLIVNALGLLLMLADKHRAKKNKWRIPERVLMGVGIIGGSIGCIIGMRLFRHKTKHLQFALGLPLILCAQVILIVLILTKFA